MQISPETRLPCSPIAAVASLKTHRALVMRLADRDVRARYRGSALGLLWALLVPLCMLGAYSFVFGVVFPTRFASTGTPGEFIVALFAGLMLHNFAAEMLTRSSTLILQNGNYVKKIIFPLEVLSPVAMLVSLFQVVVSLIVLLAGVWFVYGAVPVQAIILPLIIIPYALAWLGLSWLLASLGVYLQDIGQLSGVLSTLLLFLSPVFYPLSSVPGGLQKIILLNPISYAVEATRGALMHAEWPALYGLSLYWSGAIMLCMFGFWWFQKTRKGFADVL